MTLSSLLRGSRSFALASALALVACSAAPKQATSEADSQVDRADQDKIERSKAKIAAANRAYDAKQFGKARTLLREAAAIGAESEAYDIAQLVEKLDKREAGLYANE